MKTRILLAASAVALLVFPAQAAETKKNDADTYRLLNLFGDVFERVRSDYVEAPTDQQMIEAAITGMLSALDPHSSYLNAKSFRDMQVNTRAVDARIVIRPHEQKPLGRNDRPTGHCKHVGDRQVVGQVITA